MNPHHLVRIAVLFLACTNSTAVAYTEPPLGSYTRESPNKAFVFVMLHAARPGESDPIGAKYPASGLYRNDGSATPLWTFDDGYVREAYPASDGVHVIVQYLRVISTDPRTCGNSSSEPPANPEVFGFYANGKKIRDVRLGELLDHVAFCREHGPGWHSWLASARIDDASGTLVVTTTQGTHRTLDLKTGERLSAVFGEDRILSSGGLAAYLALPVGIGLSVTVIAGVVAVGLLLFRSRPKPRE